MLGHEGRSLDKLLLTEKQVSELTGLSCTRIRRLWANGTLISPVKLGQSLRWLVRDVEALMMRIQDDPDTRESATGAFADKYDGQFVAGHMRRCHPRELAVLGYTGEEWRAADANG